MTDIVAAVEQRVKLIKRSDYYIGCCPLHPAKSPTLVVNPKDGTFVCLTCGESGNAEYFMKKTGLIQQEPAETEIPENAERIFDLNKRASDYFNYRLKQPKYGEKYLKYFTDRGTSIESIELWKLGAAPEYGEYLLSNIRKWGYKDQEAEKAGLVYQKEGKYQDRFWDRVMFPLFDEKGNTVGFTGRAISGEAVKKMKYCNTPETELFQKRHLVYGLNFAKHSNRGFFILVEGNMDVITMHQYGFDNTVASCGTALTGEQCRLLRKYKKRVMLMYDSDQAGIKSSIKAIKKLKDNGLEVVVAPKLDPYKDPDEFLKKAGKEKMNEKIFDAMHATQFLVNNMEPAAAVRELLLNTDISRIQEFTN